MTDETLTGPEVTAMIKALVAKHGGAIKLASKLDVTPGYISHLVNGKRPGEKVRKLLGIEEIRGAQWRRVQS